MRLLRLLRRRWYERCAREDAKRMGFFIPDDLSEEVDADG